MKTKYAIKQAGSIRRLAEILGISTAAVYAWGKVVPELRAFQLKAIYPDKFK